MTREEMKKMLPIIQAYVDGKAVEYYNEHESEWVPFDKEYSFFITFFDRPEAYRIKPEPKYHPFNSKEECWNEMLKHKPFGWVTDGGYNYCVSVVYDKDTYFDVYIGNTRFHFDEASDKFRFIDSTPFGIKEGGEE